MLNTVFEVIEQFESSAEFGTVPLPTSIFDNDNEAGLSTEEESSDDSDELHEYNEKEDQKPSEELKNSCTGAVLESLKDKIRIRRESEGAGEIRNLFEPPKIYELTPEEAHKNEIRKARNRKSATQSRLKRIAREQQLEKDAAVLEKEHEDKTKELNDLEIEKLKLTLLLQAHQCNRKRVTSVSPQGQQLPQNTGLGSNVSRDLGLDDIHSSNGLSVFGLQKGLPSASNTHNATKFTGEMKLTPQFQAVHQEMSLKRKATEDITGRAQKTRPIWNQGLMMGDTSDKTLLCEDVPNLTSVNGDLSETWTNIFSPNISSKLDKNSIGLVSMTTSGSDCNTTTGNATSTSPYSNVNMHHSVSYPDEIPVHAPEVPLVASSLTTETIGESSRPFLEQIYKSDLTREQKISCIKDHLLDGFPLQLSQCSTCT